MESPRYDQATIQALRDSVKSAPGEWRVTPAIPRAPKKQPSDGSFLKGFAFAVFVIAGFFIPALWPVVLISLVYWAVMDDIETAVRKGKNG